MNVETNMASPLRMEHLQVVEMNFKRKEVIPGETELGISIKREMLDMKGYTKVVLSLAINDEDHNIDAYVKMSADFYIDIDNNDVEINDEIKQFLLEKNAVSIMFPYIRSQISLLTTQPDLLPLQIPVINVNKLLEENQ